MIFERILCGSPVSGSHFSEPEGFVLRPLVPALNLAAFNYIRILYPTKPKKAK